ncbi:MAG: hypothetical protein J6D03_08565 [Clostridia bacterium]|nr:hypothetical protein [Clostridia bacterium]
MPREDWKVERQRTYLRKNLCNENAAKQRLQQESDRKRALKAKWESRIIKLSTQGYSADEIYRVCRVQIKEQLGFDSAKMIEYFTGQIITKDEQEKAEIMDDMEI